MRRLYTRSRGISRIGKLAVGAPVPELQSELWLLTHPQLRRTARVKAFVDTLARLLRPLVPLFEGRARPEPRRLPASGA
ncbi:MAG: hypothetical protein IRZ28_06690 [Steroidobacteraceae bacterium]|nr:hypothetical protein [Steroidobacteraceae bacterium]